MRPEELSASPPWINFVARVTRRLPVARGHIIDWICRDSDKRFLARMAPELGGHVFDCSMRDIVARSVFFAGSYAQHEVAFMRAVLKPRMNFVDIGAHWGLLAMLGSYLVGNTGHVIALEPDPRMVAKLKFNLELNCITNVRVFEVAAADRNEEVALSGYHAERDGWAASRLVETVSNRQVIFMARGRRLDELLDEVGEPSIDLIKIDVEGAEDLVLLGMEPGLDRHRYSRILLELHPRQLGERSRRMSEVADLLIAKGYRGYSLDSSRKERRRAYYHPWQHSSQLLSPLELQTDGPNAHHSPHTVWIRQGLLGRE